MQIEFREPDAVDRDQIAKWIAKDSCPQHHGVDPDFWLPEVDAEGNRTEGTKCLAVTDGKGQVMFYLKLENVMRCYIQFPPEEERSRETAAYLKGAFLTIAPGAKAHGYREIIFDSKSEGLINLFQKKFGFRAAEDNFLVRL